MSGLPQELVLLALAILLPLALIAVYKPLDRTTRARQAADERAKGLLRELLSEEERRYLEQFGSLRIPSPGIPNRTYCIPAHPGMVTVYDGGEPTMMLCLQPVEPLPAADCVLVLKFIIEANETEYLRIANAQRVH